MTNIEMKFDNVKPSYREDKPPRRHRQFQFKLRLKLQLVPPPDPLPAPLWRPQLLLPMLSAKALLSAPLLALLPARLSQPPPSNRGRPRSPQSNKQQPHVSNNCPLARASRAHKATCAPYCLTHSPLVRRSSLLKSSASRSHFRAGNFLVA